MRPNFSFRKISFLLFSFLIFNCSFLIATVRYVSKTGLSIPPYTTWETAADSIQKCINISVFGDTIYVANGVYEEQVVMIPGLSLIGEGMDSCVIDPRSLVIAYTVTMSDTCLLKGFKIIGANTTNMRCINGSVINGLITLNHITLASQGIYSANSNSVIYKNKFDNLRTRGISINNSNCLVVKNYIYINAANPSEGIFIQASTSNYKPIIDSNYVETNGNGIYKNPGTRSTIKNNEIRLINGSEGIFLHSFFSDSNWVYNKKPLKN